MSKKKILLKKLIGLVILTIGMINSIEAQKTDMIVLKKRNNRTMKTYYPGSIIMAENYDGFKINGIIKQIRNDSILLQQRETRLMPTNFGFKIDTLYYSLGVNFRSIKKYYYGPGNNFNDKERKEFMKTMLPKLMTRAGIGYFVLELVNSLGRKESLKEHNNIPLLGSAALVAGGGFVWNRWHKKRNQVGGKYEAVYVKAGTVSMEEKNK